MIELIAFVLFQVATFGSYSAPASSQASSSSYEASFGNLQHEASAHIDTTGINRSGNGGWGHD